MKICKHCGTSENLFVDTHGRSWAVCKLCKIKYHKKGKDHHNFGSIRIRSLESQKKYFDTIAKKQLIRSKIVKEKAIKICKYCKTSEDLFTTSSGTVWSVCNPCRKEYFKIGKKNPNYGKPISDETHKKQSDSAKKQPPKTEVARMKQSNVRKYTLKDYQEKYPWFSLFEEMRDSPIQEIGKPGVQVHCKKCNEWFTPKSYQIIANRINALKQDKDTNYFYCSDECKDLCPLFGIKSITPTYNKITKIKSSEYQIWRKEVFQRQFELDSFNHCEKCNCVVDLEVHHEKPFKTHPLLALDPDNGIILCRECHIKFGHQDECSTGNLKSKLCI